MTRLSLSLASLSFFSVVVACGGAVAPIGNDGNPGSDNGTNNGSSSGSSGTIHCSPPACSPGDRMVGSSSSSCPDDVGCYSRTNACGMTIWCAQDNVQCAAYPSCEPGYTELQSSTCPPGPAGTECHTVTVCGTTIACMRSCEGPRPICNPGDQEVTSCPTDVYCYSRSVCDFTIYCIGSVDAGGPVPPPVDP